MEVLKLFTVFEEVLRCENTIIIPKHVKLARVMKRWWRSWSSTTSRLSRPPFALDFFAALVTGCSTVALVTTVVTVSLLAAISKACRHEFHALRVLVDTRLPLAAAVAVAVTPVALAAVLHGCIVALVAYRIFSVCPLISDLHDVGDGLRLYSSERLLQLESIDTSGERVYRVVFRYSLSRITQEGPALDVLA